MTTASDAVGSPPVDEGPDILVDWLELTALFDPFGRARLDDVIVAGSIQDADIEETIDAVGRRADEQGAQIEREIEERAS